MSPNHLLAGIILSEIQLDLLTGMKILKNIFNWYHPLHPLFICKFSNVNLNNRIIYLNSIIGGTLS